MDKITIGEKEFGFRLTVESWKRLKENGGITPANIQQKIEEDMAGTVSSIVFYGLSVEDRKTTTQEWVDANIDLSIAQTISEFIQKSVSSAKKDDDQKN
jgi:hypothetical protein